MNNIKFLIGLGFLVLFSHLKASALWGTDWTQQKNYCNKIKDVSEVLQCDRIWERLKKENRLPKDKEDYEVCGKLFDYYKDVKPTPPWSLMNSCLELIGYREGIKLPKDQMKICDWLLESGKSVPRYVFCLQEFDPQALKVCEFPKEKGNYQITGECLQAISGTKMTKTDVKRLLMVVFKHKGAVIILSEQH